MILLQRIAHAKVLNDVARGARAHSPVRVLHRVGQLHFLAILQESCRITDDFCVQSIWYSVTLFIAVVDDLGSAIDGDQERVKVQII